MVIVGQRQDGRALYSVPSVSHGFAMSGRVAICLGEPCDVVVDIRMVKS